MCICFIPVETILVVVVVVALFINDDDDDVMTVISYSFGKNIWFNNAPNPYAHIIHINNTLTVSIPNINQFESKKRLFHIPKHHITNAVNVIANVLGLIIEKVDPVWVPVTPDDDIEWVVVVVLLLIPL